MSQDYTLKNFQQNAKNRYWSVFGNIFELSIFGIGHTLATFQAVGKTFLLMQLLIILTIGEVILSTAGFI